MGFKLPRRNKDFYFLLVAKNSQMPLGVRALHTLACAIEQQQVTKPASKEQLFQIQEADYREVYFKIPHSGNYVCIANTNQPSSRQDNEVFIQFRWESMKPGLRYRLISAGNGYYHVQSVHSNLFWDVTGNSKAVGATLMQMHYNGGDNQLFKVVMAPDQRPSKDMRSFQEANEEVRNAIMMAAGGVPEIGTVLKGLLGALWKPSNKDQDFWSQMKEYVDERIRTIILEERLDRLAEDLRATLELIHDLEKDPKSTPKGNDLQGILTSLRYAEGNFLIGANKNPLEVLPYLTAMGTIKLTLLRQRIVRYDELYGTDTQVQADKAKRMAYFTEQLRKNINIYTRMVLACRAQAVAWRLSHFPPIDSGQAFSPQAHTRGYWAKADDKYDGWHLDLRYATYTDSSRTDGDPGYFDFVSYAYAQRRQQAEIQFGAEMDEYLHPARLWKHLLPSNPAPSNYATLTQMVAGFGGRGGQHSFGVPANVVVNPAQRTGRITGVTVFTAAHSKVSGLELWYDGHSTGVIGGKGNHEETMSLADDEFITGVYGTYYGIIDSICFETNHGKRVTGGSPYKDAQRWTADLPDSFGARLVRVVGRYNHQPHDTIERIDLEWAYEVAGTDLPRPEDIPDEQENHLEAEELPSLSASPTPTDEAS